MSRKYGNMQAMKTTLEIPDMIFRRAKSKAAAQGVPLRQFVTEAVEDKLKSFAHIWSEALDETRRQTQRPAQRDAAN